jgi:hypothetical protein
MSVKEPKELDQYLKQVGIMTFVMAFLRQQDLIYLTKSKIVYHDSNVYVEAQMLIRKPVEDVFEAFINPEVTTHFWFTKSTGKLEEGKTITWEWEMYGVKT